jgi:hypothetical protein
LPALAIACPEKRLGDHLMPNGVCCDIQAKDVTNTYVNAQTRSSGGASMHDAMFSSSSTVSAKKKRKRKRKGQ